MARTFVKLQGFKECDAALGELNKATARHVLLRVLKRAGERIAEAARRLVPKRTGLLARSIIVSTRLANPVGKKEYADTLAAGGTKAEAVAALRGARRAAKGEGGFAEMYVGAGQVPHAHMVEYGSVNNRPQPYLRPAFDAEKDAALGIIARDLEGEIAKAAARAAAKGLRRSGG